MAAVEFALCGAILLALAALGVVPAATAVRWAVVILVPLSVTIGFLGIWAGILGWRLIPRSHGSTLVNASQAA